MPLRTGTREPRFRLAVFFLLIFSSSPGWRFAFLHADERFHGADSGDRQYQRFTFLTREQVVLTNQGVQIIDQRIQSGPSDFHYYAPIPCVVAISPGSHSPGR